jgi:hypothetical protein
MLVFSLAPDGSVTSQAPSPIVYTNSAYALSMPDLTTNADGEVAMSYEFGGGPFYAGHGMGILTGTPGFVRDAVGNSDGSQPGNPAGDYTTVGVDSPYTSCFISAGITNTASVSPPVSPGSQLHFSIFARRGSLCAPPSQFSQTPNPTLTLSCPGQVQAGDTLSVSGNMTPPAPGEGIHLHYVRAHGTFDDHTVPMNAQGDYIDSEPTSSDQIGTWSVQATWDGNGNSGPARAGQCLVRVVGPPPPGTQPSSITLHCPQGTQPGTVTVTGDISPVISNAPVHITYVPTDPSLTEVDRTTNADANAHYSDTTGLASSDWTVQAYWDGNAGYQGATSPSCHVFVQVIH